MLSIATVDILPKKFCKNEARDFIEVHFSKNLLFDCRRLPAALKHNIFGIVEFGTDWMLKIFFEARSDQSTLRLDIRNTFY